MVDDDIAAAIPEDVRGGRAAHNLHVALVAPLPHSEQYNDVEGVRAIPVRPPPGYQTRVLSAGVDYAQVRALLARCERAHGTVASSGGDDDDMEGEGEGENFTLEKVLPDLLVIDCEAERLVPAGAGCRFAALSYVWGRSRKSGKEEDDEEPFQADLRRRRRPLPRTVRDAMHVVRELGLQFLWVDRYCIPNDSAAPGSKHHTISNMDAIYQRAALTIVAASGAHSDHGLPGSRRIHRRLGTYSLVESSGRGNDGELGADEEENEVREAYVYIEEAHAELSELIWSTRGWTYQEGLLSQHRLVFTELQAVFQCQHDHNHNHNGSSSSSGLVARAGDVFYSIEEYTRRHLTYPSDSLRAFLGVLRAFEKLRPPARHLWGVPFVFGEDGRVRQLAQGLLWKSQSCRLRRVRGIPSWSWAGWEGWASQQQQQRQGGEPEEEDGSRTDHSVWMYGLLPVDPSLADLDDILIDVPCGAGNLLGLEEYFRTQREGRRRGAPLPPEHAIYITAWTTEISFAPGRRREYVLDLDTRSDFRFGPVAAGGLHGGRSETLTVAVICWALSNSTRAARDFRTQSLVLARAAGSDSFCRVGTLETRWRKEHLVEDGKGGAHIAAWDRHFVRRRLRIV